MLRSKQSFSLVEVILSVAIFALIVLALVGALIYGRQTTAIAGTQNHAVFLAEEGLEALRNLRDENFLSLVDGPHGISTSSNVWVLSGASDSSGPFTRQVIIGSVNSYTKNVTSTVTWQQSASRSGQVSLSTYLTNWRRERGGMLVYGENTAPATADLIRYRILDPNTATWGSANTAADVDGGAFSNKVLRAVQVYSSATRNEKVMISRHFDGSSQFIYAQVWNGTSSSWGNVQLLSSWAVATFPDVQNFSGTYLANGDFMVVYADNTSIPKFRTWNGSAWSAQIAMPNLSANGSGIPNFIVAKNRPGSNEVMVAFFDQSSDTNTMYFNFNSGVYNTADWTLHARHSAVAPAVTKRLVDFAWSPNTTTTGGLVYSDSATDVALNIKIWTANGSGGGSWSATANAAAQANRLGAVSISGRPGANEFIACDKDANAAPRVICYRSNFIPAWTNPTNPIIAPSPPGTATNIQRSYDIAFEPLTGGIALGVYSDNSTAPSIPKLKKYNATTNTWDAAATSLNRLGGLLETVRLVPHPETDDVMILLGDTNQDLYSAVWDGVNDNLYLTPAGKAFSTHGVNGSADTDFWFDFAWDKF